MGQGMTGGAVPSAAGMMGVVQVSDTQQHAQVSHSTHAVDSSHMPICLRHAPNAGAAVLHMTVRHVHQT